MSTEVYRQAASILVLRQSSKGLEILLLHKPRKRDAWQLPQGGVEQGESIEEAALRELHEEAGINASILGKSDIVYQYDFPTSYRRFRPDHVKGQHISFVYASVPADAVVTVDAKEIDKSLWIQRKELSRYIKRKAYLEIVNSVLDEAIAKFPKR